MSSKLTTDVDKRLLQKTKFPPEFNTKVDMTKVNVPVIKKWVSDEIERILGSDDDVVTDTIFNLIESTRYPNIKELQISLNGFLDKDSPKFCHELWKYCISAQENPQGIPKELLEAKKAELLQEKAEEDRAREEVRKRQEADRERELEISRVRDRERSERGRGRGGHDSDRRPYRRDSRSRSPPRRRDGDDFYRNQTRGDTYVPGRGRRDGGLQSRRRRSPSPDRSPPRRRQRNSRSPLRKRRDRSASRERGNERKNGRNGDADRRSRSRSPPRRRRSQSPRRRQPHGSSSYARDDRSPRPKRTRNPSQSRSRSPPRKKRPSLATNDLMASKDRSRLDETRLSREVSATPPVTEMAALRRNTSSVESGDAKEFNFLGAANRAPSQRQERLDLLPRDLNKRIANELLAQQLRTKLLKERAEREGRRDSGVGIPMMPNGVQLVQRAPVYLDPLTLHGESHRQVMSSHNPAAVGGALVTTIGASGD